MNRPPEQKPATIPSAQRSDAASDTPDYEDLPSLTNRTGPLHGDDAGFGTREQGGYGTPSATQASGDPHHSSADDEPASRYTPASQSAKGAATAGGVTRPDANIVDDLTDRLARDEQLEAGEILIMVDAGVLTLTGNVPDPAMKQRAEHLAAQVEGVSAVHNRIRVDDGSASFGPPGEAVRSGHGQTGSGFATSDRSGDDTTEEIRGSR